MSEMHTPWRVEADERNYEVRGNLTSDTYIAGYNIYTADGDEVVGCEGIIDLTSDRADFIVHCVNSYASLVEENEILKLKLRGAVDDAEHWAGKWGMDTIRLEEENKRMREALERLLEHWDANGKERRGEFEGMEYWSPASRMVDTEFVVAIREALGDTNA